jgi:chitinase
MVWAIDLDDGTLIEALGSNLNRPKADIYDEGISECRLGTDQIVFDT